MNLTNLKCHRCKHDWTYRGNRTRYTNCPKCATSVKIVFAEKRRKPKYVIAYINGKKMKIPQPGI